MTRSADVVVIGGGCMGTSIAMHLAQRGVSRVTLVEKGALAGGATGRSSGIVRQHYSHPKLAELARRSLEYFSHFQEIVGEPSGFTRTGYLLVVGPNDLPALRANVQAQRAVGVKTQLLSGGEISELVPIGTLEGIGGGAFEPEAGYADPVLTTSAFAGRARDLGARIFQETAALGIKVEGGRVRAALTSAGEIPCGAVVNCAGGWGRRIGQMVSVDLPIVPILHRIAVFGLPPGPALAHPLPVYSDTVNLAYYRPETGGLLLMGASYNRSEDAIDPDRYPDSPDPASLERYVEKAARRFPCLAGGEVRKGYNGFYDTTPDTSFILDEIPGMEGFFCAVGFNGHGFKHSPVIGQLMAEWIAEGRDSPGAKELSIFSLRRFGEGRLLTPPHPYSGAPVGR